MSDTSIEWTDKTWNPVAGCSRVSKGCEHCYAERFAIRLPKSVYVRSSHSGPRWTGRVDLVPARLAEPLRWKKPQRVFVNSMSDLFHEKISFEDIDRVFAAMSRAPQHTFQVLTKRPERMRLYMDRPHVWTEAQLMSWWRALDLGPGVGNPPGAFSEIQPVWPLPNVWLGVSVEDRLTAAVRLNHLENTKAALRFVSYEPALEEVGFRGYLRSPDGDAGCIDWIIVGGESGPGARPFCVSWARETIADCKEAGVPVFVKQLGARVFESQTNWRRPSGITHKKGADMDEWPEDLRVREFPLEPVRA